MFQELIGKVVSVIKVPDALGAPGFQVLSGILEKLDPEKGYLVLRATEPVGGWLPDMEGNPPLYVIPWHQIRWVTNDKVQVGEEQKSKIALPSFVGPNGFKG